MKIYQYDTDKKLSDIECGVKVQYGVRIVKFPLSSIFELCMCPSKDREMGPEGQVTKHN